MTNDDMVPVDVDSIKILMHGDDDLTLKTLALGLSGPELLIGLTMGDDEAITFTVETGGIPIEDDVYDSYEGIAQVLSMLGSQIQDEVDRARGEE